ncbi:MAG: TonB-dependent receptor [Methylophilaceae bacterium]
MKRIVVLNLCFAVAAPALAEEVVQKLEEIKVSGKRDDISERRESGSQKIIIDRNEIESMSVMTIGEVMGKIPGVELRGDAPRARGMSRDSVNILIDGERQANGSLVVSGALGRLPSGELERVEILRGSSAEFGGSASVTVNLVLKKARPKRSTEVKVGLNSRGSALGYSISWTENGGSGNFGWSLPISLIWSDTPLNTLIDRQSATAGSLNSWDHEHVSGLSKLGHHALTPRFNWKSGSDSLSFSPMFFYGPLDRENNTELSLYTNPGTGSGLVPNGMTTAIDHSLNQVIRMRLDGEKHFGEGKFTARAAFNNSRRSLQVVRNAFSENSVSTDDEINTAMRWDQPVNQHLLSIGAEYVKLMRRDEQEFDGFLDNDYHNTSSRDAILWMQDEWSLGKEFTLTSGMRIESLGIVADGIAQNHIGWLPSIAARWEPINGWVMRTSLGIGIKMPKLEEISNTVVRSIAANTPIEADRRGNGSLRPERNLNFEAVLEHYLAEKAGVIGANIYIRRTSDFIERRMELQGVRWIDRPYNEGEALHYGIELDAKVKTDPLGWKGATAKAHLTLPYSQVDDIRLGLRRMARETPQYVLSLGLDQSLPQWDSNFGVSAQISGRSETDIPVQQSGYTEARAVLDAYWVYKINPRFNLRFAGQNLLAADTRRQNSFYNGLNVDANDVRQVGYRNLMVTLEGRW